MRVLLLLSLLAAGCGHFLPGHVPCPNSGGPVWHELRSRNFQLDTDLDEPEAAQWIKDLEQLEATVIGAVSPKPVTLPGRLRVVIPKTLATYAELAPDTGTLGYFYSHTFFHEPTIVIRPDALKGDPEVIAHEIGHYVSFHIFPRHPEWFEEGVVQFAQTVANPDPRFHNLAGLMPRLRILEVARGNVPPADVKKLFAWKGMDTGTLELWAWGLFHWLWTNRPDQLDDYQRRLLANTSPDEAWAQAFGDLDLGKSGNAEKVNALIDKHLREAKFDSYYEVKASSDPAYVQRVVPAAQIHVLLLDVRLNWLHRQTRSMGVQEDKQNTIEEQLRFAMGDDPNEPVAGFKLRMLKKSPVLAGARTAAAAHPDDWRAFAMLALAEEPASPEQGAAWRKAAELNPDNAYANERVADFLKSKPEEAFGFARRAAQLAPDDPYSLETLAAVAVSLGRCQEARTLVDRAADHLSDDDALRGKLQRDWDACRK